jgi:hypothetical protein
MGAIGFEAHLQTLVIPAGWSGLSTFLDPFNGDVEAMFAPAMEQLIMLQNFDGMFWPPESIQTLGPWDFHSGYMIKVDEPVTLPVAGYPVVNRTLMLHAGWNLVPVMCSCGISCDELAGQLGSNLLIIKEIAGNSVFWPDMNIASLQTLESGSSYLLLLLNDDCLQFQNCD